MLVSTGALPEGADVAVEPKWDGVRCMAYVTAEGVRLETRRGRSVSDQTPEVGALASALGERETILDGELVVLDDSGRPDFYRVMRRLALSRDLAIEWARRRQPLTYVVFDVLWLDGSPLVAHPYEERRRTLESLALAGPAWHTSPSYRLAAPDVFDACSGLGLEGVVTKALDSPYRPGTRSRSWIKHKSDHWRQLNEHRRRPIHLRRPTASAHN